MTTLHVALTKVTGLWLLLPLLVDWRRLAAAEKGSGQCVKGNVGADCIFYKDFCKWSSGTWEVSGRWDRAQFRTDRFNHGVLQSPLICSTQWAVHCLSFHYQFLHQSKPVTLTVVLEVDGRGNVSVWQLRDKTPGYYTGTAPIRTTADFRILFQVEKPQYYNPGAGSYVAVSKIAYNETECSVSPPDATSKPQATTTPKPPVGVTSKPPATSISKPRATTTTTKPPIGVTSKLPTRDTSKPSATSTSKPSAISTSRPCIGRPVIILPNTKKPSTRRSMPTRPSVSKRPSPSPSPSSVSPKPSNMHVTSASDGLPDDSCTGIIIGAVVAVVVIVAVGVFLLVAKRKKMFWFRPKDSSSQPVAMVSLLQRDLVTAPDPASVEGGSANGQSETAGRGNDAPPEGGRHRAAETGRRGTSPTRPAGTGGIQPGPEDDGEYHVVDLVGQRHGPEGARVAGPREGQHVPDDGHYHLPWVDHAPPGAVPAAGSSYLAARGGAEDEYSCLGLAGKKTALAGEKESGGCRLYDHVGGGERDVYSHVQRDREPPVILDQVYSHIH
ncbi:uncharacterized protein LOC143301221 [Babylonia areolata]|uniref:uncharacterized protein LOC143301221 n=1 Tax=Babylonia areolata TaxID=304850 RepID=UPI003FD677C8